MKKFKKAIKIKLDVYDRDVFVLLNYTPKETRNYINKSEIPDKNKEAFLKFFPDDLEQAKGTHIGNGVYSIITLDSYNDLPDLINTITHEASHCTFRMLEHAGMKLGSKSEEAYTYLLGYIVEETYRGIVEPLIVFNSKLKLD